MTENNMPQMNTSIPASSENGAGEPVFTPKVGLPIVIDPNGSSENEAGIETPIDTRNGIEVVALRAGFMNQDRKVEGDKFTVPTFNDLGEWMKCVDSTLEKKHQEIIKAKKLANRAKAIK